MGILPGLHGKLELTPQVPPRQWLCCATVGDRRSRRFVVGWVALQAVTPAFVHTDDDGLSSPAAVFPLSVTEQRKKVDPGYRQHVASPMPSPFFHVNPLPNPNGTGLFRFCTRGGV